jgi:biotin transport system ATP-binding protein
MKKEIIIFDEPFANLDYPGVRGVLALIQRLKAEKKTTLILTHELEKSLSLANRLAVLGYGKLAVIDESEKALLARDESWGIRDPRVNYAKIEDCTWL